MEKKRRLILLLAISLCIPVLGFAETIVLKSGKTVEGKITEKTDKYIKMNFQGAQGAEVTYLLKDIERIDSSPIVAQKQPLTAEASNPEYEKPPQEEKKKGNLVIVGDATNTYASYFFVLSPGWLPVINEQVMKLADERGFWMGKRMDNSTTITIVPSKKEKGQDFISFINSAKEQNIKDTGCSPDSMQEYTSFKPSIIYSYKVYNWNFPKGTYGLSVFIDLPNHVIFFNLSNHGESEKCITPYFEDFNNIISDFRWILGLSDDEIGNLLKKN